MVDSLVVRNVLREAATLYAEAPSHAPIGDYPECGMHCAITAVTSATYARNMSISQAMVVSDALIALNKAAGRWIVGYNADHTTEEVLAVFEKASSA